MPGVAITALGDSSDAVAAGSIGSVAIDRLTGFNGSTYDRIRTLGATSLLGLGQLSVSSAIPGASTVKASRQVTVSGSQNRVTIATPASGKKLRIVAINLNSSSLTESDFGVYFGTGASVASTPANVIFEARVGAVENIHASIVFPEGGGPVGAADAVASLATGSDIGGDAIITIVYREE
jgi:hypothetical protein